MIHLDTSFLIRALVPGTREDRHLRLWIGNGDELAMSAVAWTELLCGPLSEGDVTRVEVLVRNRPAFDTSAASLAAELYNRTGRRRGSLLDCMIAAAALRDDAPLATSNRADFERFAAAGLRLA